MNSLLTESQLYSLLDAISLINSTLDLDKILEIVMQEITNSLQADRSTLYIVEHSQNIIWSKIAQGDKTLEIRQEIGKGISGYVAQSGEVLNIEDAYQDDRFNPEVDKKTGYQRPYKNQWDVLNKIERVREEKLDALIEEWSPDVLIVGLPRKTDGSDSAMTSAVREFATTLGERYKLQE